VEVLPGAVRVVEIGEYMILIETGNLREGFLVFVLRYPKQPDTAELENRPSPV